MLRRRLTLPSQMPLFEQLASLTKPSTSQRASNGVEVAERDASAQSLRSRGRSVGTSRSRR